jgi:pentatricopeptide repeat protein
MRNHAAARLLIDAYMSLGSFDEALELLRELLGSHKPNAEDEFLAGVCCYNARLLTEAQKHYENALRLAPKHLAAKEDLIRVRAKLRVGSKKRIAKSKSF